MTPCHDSYMTTTSTAATSTGYICKSCGAESPAGIGYIGTPEADAPAADCINLHA